MNRRTLVLVALALVGCPLGPKDEETGKDDGARESQTGSESGEKPKPEV